MSQTTDCNTGLFERMRDMHRLWVERLQEIRQIESDFGSRRLSAKNPSEARTICNEWMAKRLAVVASEQQLFAAAWLDLISEAAVSAPAPFATGPEPDQAISWRM